MICCVWVFEFWRSLDVQGARDGHRARARRRPRRLVALAVGSPLLDYFPGDYNFSSSICHDIALLPLIARIIVKGTGNFVWPVGVGVPYPAPQSNWVSATTDAQLASIIARRLSTRFSGEPYRESA